MISRVFLIILGFFMFPLFGNSQINFVDQAVSLGLNLTCGTTYIGNGVTFYDYNQDGWDDISFTTENGQDIRFFKNTAGVFTEENLNVPTLNYQTRQVNWVDYDNDGDKDLYVTSDTDGNKLFENDGSMNFSDVTNVSGLPTTNIFTYGASWGDYNNDSFLDVFICSFDSAKVVPNYLYKNNGNGTFTDVSSTAGISNVGHLSFCSAFFDYNNDGWQDIYISNDRIFNPNILYMNNGDGTFTDKSVESGTDITLDAMTVTVGDYNSDGWFDIYVTNSPKDNGNAFLKNNGDGTFTDIAALTGTQQYGICWGAVFLDAENDSDLDLYVSSSASGGLNQADTSKFFENLGNDNFQTPTDPGFFNDTRASHSNAIGDVDNDGLLDIIVTNTDDGKVNLWKNQTNTTNNWLKIKLNGVTSNSDGVGSIIEISVNGNKQYRYTHCGEGYLSQNSGVEIFGVGTNTNVDYVKVTWLSGVIDTFNNVSVNQELSITEGSGSLSINRYDIRETKISPNPTNNEIYIQSSENINKLVVFDLSGKKVIEKLIHFTDNRAYLNLSSLKSGTYILKTKFTNDFIKNFKIVKL